MITRDKLTEAAERVNDALPDDPTDAERTEAIDAWCEEHGVESGDTLTDWAMAGAADGARQTLHELNVAVQENGLAGAIAHLAADQGAERMTGLMIGLELGLAESRNR